MLVVRIFPKFFLEYINSVGQKEKKNLSEVKYVWMMQCIVHPLWKFRIQINVLKDLKSFIMKVLFSFANPVFPKQVWKTKIDH